MPSIDSDNFQRKDSDTDDGNLKPIRVSETSLNSEAPRRKRGILEPLAPFDSARSAEAELTNYEKDEQ